MTLRDLTHKDLIVMIYMNNFSILRYSARGRRAVLHTALHSAQGKALQNTDGLAVPGSSSVSWAKPHHHYASSLFSKIIRTHRNHQTLMRKQIHARENNSDILRPNLPRAPTNAVSTYQRKTICGIWKTKIITLRCSTCWRLKSLLNPRNMQGVKGFSFVRADFPHGSWLGYKNTLSWQYSSSVN